MHGRGLVLRPHGYPAGRTPAPCGRRAQRRVLGQLHGFCTGSARVRGGNPCRPRGLLTAPNATHYRARRCALHGLHGLNAHPARTCMGVSCLLGGGRIYAWWQPRMGVTRAPCAVILQAQRKQQLTQTPTRAGTRAVGARAPQPEKTWVPPRAITASVTFLRMMPVDFCSNRVRRCSKLMPVGGTKTGR